MPADAAIFRLLPSVDKLLQSEAILYQIEQAGHDTVKKFAQQAVDSLRQAVAANDAEVIERIQKAEFFDELCIEISSDVENSLAPTLVRVLNLTGTVVHTNLGRAKLPREAIEAMERAAAYATNLEFDLDTGKRGDRDSHLEQSLCELTGAEAATVVNNNAAAVVLVLNTLAQNKEVIVSRGELVEIGGAFRIPDVMRSAQSELKEVGTTNRTHLKDFEEAISDATGVVMKVHTSNYEIRGFTKSVDEDELSALCAEKSIPFVSDLGSGTLIDLSQYGLPHEPTVQETLAAGADLVTFSGDKLLGGPQAGVIVGKKELISQIKRNPLKRALRVDKVTLAALLEVINLYKDPRRLQRRLPILQDLARPLSEISALAERILPPVAAALSESFNVTIQPCKSQIGSGALPLDLLESRAISIEASQEQSGKDTLLTQLSAQFRQLPTPIIGRLHDGALLLDLRCLQLEDEREFLKQLETYSKTA